MPSSTVCIIHVKYYTQYKGDFIVYEYSSSSFYLLFVNKSHLLPSDFSSTLFQPKKTFAANF